MAGRQRSCAIVAAYLMRYHNYHIDDAIHYIKTKRPYAFFISVNFKHALLSFKQTLLYKNLQI